MFHVNVSIFGAVDFYSVKFVFVISVEHPEMTFHSQKDEKHNEIKKKSDHVIRHTFHDEGVYSLTAL